MTLFTNDKTCCPHCGGPREKLGYHKCKKESCKHEYSLAIDGAINCSDNPCLKCGYKVDIVIEIE